MESIYNPDFFDSTDNINIKDYFEKYSQELFEQQKIISLEDLSENKLLNDELINSQSRQLENDSDAKIFSLIKGLSEERQKNLANLCSPNNLTIKGETNQLSHNDVFGKVGLSRCYKSYEITPESLKLETVKKYSERSPHTKWKEDEIMMKKHFELSIDTVNDKNHDLQPGKDFVVYVRLFKPFVFNYAVIDKRKYLSYDHEIILTGSNTLADLKDKIFCVGKSTVVTDVSTNLRTDNVLTAEEKYPSSFIFIDNVFYNDFRNPESIDYSQVIRKWALEKKIDDFTTQEMDKTRIDSLQPRFGYPYVYQHHGRCEHIFIFSQARLLTSLDCLNSKEYPYYSGISGTKTTFCYICGNSQAMWLVIDCERLPLNKSPLCTECFKSYCYLDGKKIGNFKCYPYSNKKHF